MEAFPDPIADRIEDGLASIVIGLQHFNLGFEHIRTGRDLIGRASLDSRRNARMRRNKQNAALANARKAKQARSDGTERLAG
jgi:hypothetical protein